MLDSFAPACSPEGEHIFDDQGTCWCNPELEHICRNGTKVWVHPDPDGSEPPIEMIAEAIVRAAFSEHER